jgi:hypothetical protein
MSSKPSYLIPGSAADEKSEEKDPFSAARSLAQYLGILLAVDYDIDAIDRVAKARRLEDFAEGIYNALRRRENLLQRIKEKMKNIGDERDKTALSEAIRLIEGFSAFKVDTLINSLKTRNDAQLKLIASYIGSRALAFTETERKVREIFEKRQEQQAQQSEER